MTLIDTSAWVEFLRRTGSATNQAVRATIESDHAIAEPVRMEVLAGARNERNLADLERLLARATLIPTRSHHWDEAARLYRVARAQGVTVRRMIDCLIAAIAIEADLPVLHEDGDFTGLARVTSLRLAS